MCNVGDGGPPHIQVLVVEDEPIERLVLQTAVRRLGHECIEAEDGGQAWEMFRTHHPDVVVSDLQMPGLDGAELCRRVRTLDHEGYTPFIFVTGHDDADHARLAMESGGDDFLTKPLHMEELSARLAVATRLKRVESERLRLLARERSAREAAERAVAQRDAVLAAVSHDLRTPLMAIRGHAALQIRRLSKRASDNAEPLLSALRRIDRAAERMNRWIDDLLDATRLEEGQPLPLKRGVINLGELARQAVEEHPVSDQHRLQLVSEDARGVVMGDAQRLRRVLDNLLSNAIKYSPAGGDVTIGIDARGPWVRMWVHDNGIGIPAADLGHVFEWSYRSANVGRVGGYGLGLAGARAVIQQHGGSLTVESEVGAGSTFTVSLPAARTPKANAR